MRSQNATGLVFENDRGAPCTCYNSLLMILLSYRCCKFIFRYVVPAPLRYPLARAIAWAICTFNARRRNVLIGNLTPLVGAEKAARLAPVLLGNFSMTAVDFFCTRTPAARRRVTLEGWSRVETAYHKSRRVMIVTAHLGNWEIGISEIIEKGYPVAGLYATYTDDAIVQWIASHRNPHAEWIPTAPGAADACVTALQNGRILCLAADIPFGEQGRRVMIAGRPVRLPMGPWAIALRANAVVIPAFVLRQEPGRYRGILHEPIKPTTESLRTQMVKMQDVYRRHLEHYLKTYPEQWGNLQPFWEKS
jgi:lauroyl/myristoyl acyltransferase